MDKTAYYLGSQNLYIANLGEWGIIVDDEKMTKKVMGEYWNPLWEQSYTENDCDIQKVMDGLGIDRDGGSWKDASAEERKDTLDVMRRAAKAPGEMWSDLGEIMGMHGIDHEENGKEKS